MRHVVRVGWLDSPDEDLTVMVLAHPRGDSLEIQRSANRRQDDSDHEFGDYCLVRDAGPTHYGGVRSHRVTEDTLVLELTPEAADVLQLPQAVRFHLPTTEADRVSRWLADLLA